MADDGKRGPAGGTSPETKCDCPQENQVESAAIICNTCNKRHVSCHTSHTPGERAGSKQQYTARQASWLVPSFCQRLSPARQLVASPWTFCWAARPFGNVLFERWRTMEVAVLKLTPRERPDPR